MIKFKDFFVVNFGDENMIDFKDGKQSLLQKSFDFYFEFDFSFCIILENG